MAMRPERRWTAFLSFGESSKEPPSAQVEKMFESVQNWLPSTSGEYTSNKKVPRKQNLIRNLLKHVKT